MQPHQQLKTSSHHAQRGITLIESLVAILVTALGILGILGVQMRTLTDTQTSVRRAQAMGLSVTLDGDGRGFAEVEAERLGSNHAAGETPQPSAGAGKEAA